MLTADRRDSAQSEDAHQIQLDVHGIILPAVGEFNAQLPLWRKRGRRLERPGSGPRRRHEDFTASSYLFGSEFAGADAGLPNPGIFRLSAVLAAVKLACALSIACLS